MASRARPYTEAVAIGDVNGDRRPDLLAAGSIPSGASGVAVLLNRGQGGFRTAPTSEVGGAAVSLAVGDLNGDGKLDVATANVYDKNVSVLINRGDGSFLPHVDYPTGREPWDVAIGDLNGDGKPDLAAAVSSGFYGGPVHRVAVLLNAGDGTFQNRIDYRAARRPESIALADLNRDGKLDVATANSSDLVSVFVNRGDGSLEARADYRAGSGPHAIAIADVNGGRGPDLVAENTGNINSEWDSISVLLNKGDAKLRPKIDSVARFRSLHVAGGSLAIGDLNGDRRPDVAIALGWIGVSVLVNSGDGRFKQGPSYDTGGSPEAGEGGGRPRSIAIGDLNGDGKRDIVATQRKFVAVLLNRTRR